MNFWVKPRYRIIRIIIAGLNIREHTTRSVGDL